MTVITSIVAASADDSFQDNVGANSPAVTPLNVRASSTDYRTVAVRFQVTGPASGDTVNDAYLRCYFTHTARDDIHADVVAEAVDNAAAFTSTANHITDRIAAGVTTAKFEWNNTGTGIGYYSTGAGSLTAVIQEIINRPGWSSGNYIVLFLDPRAYTDDKFGWIEAYEAGTGNYPELTIDYTAGGASPVTVAVNPATLSLSPQTIVPTPGTPPVTVAVNPATLNLSPQTITPIVGGSTPVAITVNPATLTLWAQPVAIVRGTPAATPVTVQVNPATLRLIGQPVNVTIPGDAILIGESNPLSLSVTTTNNLEHGLGTHTHTIEASAAPGVTESLLKTDTLGELHLARFQADEINNHLIARATDTFDLGSQDKLWRHGWLSELDTVLFAENTVTLLGGWFVVSKDAGTLAEDVTAVQTTIDFGKAMTQNDFVIFRASLAVEYVQIGTLVSGTTYNVTRDVDGGGANTWPQGQPFMVTGNTGDGRIELNAYDTPRIQILEQGAAYNAQTELIRMGDLNGNWGYSAETHGIALGEYAASKSNLTWDPTNGLRLRTYDLTVLQLDNAGNASIEGFLSIGSSGGIYQGTGTPASPTTGIKLWNDAGIGRLAGYNGGTLQAEFASDGKIKAGGGTVTLDENGVQIQSTATWPTPGNEYTLDLMQGNIYGFSGLDSGGVAIEVGGKTLELLVSSTEKWMNVTGFQFVADSGVMSASSIAAYSPGAGNIGYTGNLKSYKNSTSYNVYGYHPYNPKKTSTSWNGDPKSGSGNIDLYSVFGVPLNVQAVAVRLIIVDGTASAWLALGVSSADAYYVTARMQVSNRAVEASGIIPVSSGRYIRYTTSEYINQVWIEIMGYYI